MPYAATYLVTVDDAVDFLWLTDHRSTGYVPASSGQSQ